MQEQHLCDLQPEDLSLHSTGADDRQSAANPSAIVDETATEQTSTEELENEGLLWKPEKSLPEESEEASCSMEEEAIASAECKESTGRPSSRETETPATTAAGIANVLGSSGDVTTSTTSASVQDATTASSDETVVEKLDETIATPTETEDENL